MDVPRVVIEGIEPSIDGGAFPIKRVAGETVTVEADVFTDGHDAVSVTLLERHASQPHWNAHPMRSIHNDRFRASFAVTELGTHLYVVSACVDPFATWRHGIEKKIEAGQDVGNEQKLGAALRDTLCAHDPALKKRAARLPLPELAELMDEVVRTTPALPRSDSKQLEVTVDRERARFSAWYEFFPRSTSGKPGVHGTLRDCERMLEHVAALGFDVVYLPPIHPIGAVHRKGKNNALNATRSDVGCPWAIRDHKAIHPELGTLADWKRFVAKARSLQIDVALDIAFQCAPDHAYVKAHPKWFRWRADGTVQYAENPPKKYEDVLPFDFDTEEREALWNELLSVFTFWIEHGVTVFRVDNPHTKPFAFWQWLIAEVKRAHPETIFLSEAFTRPKLKYRLAKLGFSQSYTYFAWRNTKQELSDYLTELTRTKVVEFFRGNLWPNTPDILTEHLQHGGRPAFVARAVLASTLGASWGIYGPPYEHCVATPREKGSEEYLDSEKYELKVWDHERRGSLTELIARLNRIRRENPALHSDRSLRFHATDNEQLLCYSKRTDAGTCVILVVVNLDPHHKHCGHVELALDELCIDGSRAYQVHDLLCDARYLWHGPRNYVELDPQVVPAHVFRVRRFVRRENEFDYYV